MTSVEGRPGRVEERSGCIRARLARGYESERCRHAWTLAPVGIVLECVHQNFAGLSELGTCFELPNDLAGLASLSLNYALEVPEHVLLRHPFVPMAFAKW